MFSAVFGRESSACTFIYRSSLKVQAEVGMFAAKYRLLTAEGIAPAQALITAFRHYRSVVHQPSFSFDEAFFVVSNLDGIWAASTRTSNSAPAAVAAACTSFRAVLRQRQPAVLTPPDPTVPTAPPARAPPHPDHTSPASGTDAEAVTVPAALEAQIRSLRTERIFEQLGAHPRVVATTGASAPAHRRSSSRHREGPTHIDARST